jgi:hypothetical protein
VKELEEQENSREEEVEEEIFARRSGFEKYLPNQSQIASQIY